MSLLEITNVTKDFGGLAALQNVCMKINEGDIIKVDTRTGTYLERSS